VTLRRSCGAAWGPARARRLVDQATARGAWFDPKCSRTSCGTPATRRRAAPARRPSRCASGCSGRGHPAEARLRTKLARVLWRARGAARPRSRARCAGRNGREHLRATARVLPERQALTYEAVRASGLDVALSAGRKAHEPGGSAVKERPRCADRSRALVLDELAGRRSAAGPRPACGPGDLAAAGTPRGTGRAGSRRGSSSL
jgi:hypothetical protein